MLLKLDWVCPYCNNNQGKVDSVFYNCIHCKRVLDVIYCEHCGQEYKIERWA